MIQYAGVLEITGAFAHRIILQHVSVSSDVWLGLRSGNVSEEHSGEIPELNTSSLNPSAMLLSLFLPHPCPCGITSGERKE